MKYVETSYENKTQILKFADHWVGVAVTIEADNVSAADNILKAGSVIGGIGGSVLADESLKVEKKNTVDVNADAAEGVLLDDVDISYGDASGTMLVHGFVNTNKLPETVVDEALKALRDNAALVMIE